MEDRAHFLMTYCVKRSLLSLCSQCDSLTHSVALDHLWQAKPDLPYGFQIGCVYFDSLLEQIAELSKRVTDFKHYIENNIRRTTGYFRLSFSVLLLKALEKMEKQSCVSVP